MQTRAKKHKITKEIFQQLAGNWNFCRYKNDDKIATGSACFNEITERELHYKEEGKLTVTTSLDFYKEYRYCLVNGAVKVFFISQNKKKLFYNLNVLARNITAQYKCGNDIYKASYELNFPNQIQISYAVKGPLKDYLLTTIYKRENN